MSQQKPPAFLCMVLGLDVLSQRAWSFSDIWMFSTLGFALPDIYLNLTSCHKGHEAFQTTGYLPYQTLPCQILSFKLSPLRAVMQESYQCPSLDPSESANVHEWWTWRNSQEFRLLMHGEKDYLFIENHCFLGSSVFSSTALFLKLTCWIQNCDREMRFG